jgi:hypothetical protein
MMTAPTALYGPFHRVGAQDVLPHSPQILRSGRLFPLWLCGLEWRRGSRRSARTTAECGCERFDLLIRLEGNLIVSRFVGMCALHKFVGTILPSGPRSAIASFGSSKGHSLLLMPSRLLALGQENHGCSPSRPRSAWFANSVRDCMP